MARLPKPGGDNGVWGDILNEFLKQEHNAVVTTQEALESKRREDAAKQIVDGYLLDQLRRA